jgi:2-keto-3-deoxy-L-rhamnonate aldolase RhmA
MSFRWCNVKKNFVKEKLKLGKPTIGLWVTTGHPDLAEIYARCGFDWLWFDLEHGNIGMETLHQMIQAIDALPCIPIVRVAWNDPVQVKCVLDMGALGIIFPWIETKDDAIKAVRSCRYGPSGNRGVCPRKASNYFFNLQEYVKTANDEILILALIETPTGVNNLDEILSVDGIDGIVIGDWDLSSQMGYLDSLGSTEFPHPKVREMIQKVRDKCKRAKKPVMMFGTNASEINRLIEEGHTLLCLGGDIELYQIYKNEIEKIKR